MALPGRFLSHPPMATKASNRSAKATSSMESAITSRLTREACMPSVPMEMPSLTVMVPNSKGVAPAERMPSRAAWASLPRWMLQGVTSLALLAMPMNGRFRSSSPSPIARSMARAGARSGPSVISRLRCFMFKAVACVIKPSVDGLKLGAGTR